MRILKQKIIMACLLIMPMISNAQFATNPPFFTYGFTAFPATMQKIGIGSFPTNASVQAKLHINQFLLAANAPTNGFLFRTDGDQSVVNQWQLFTGPNANALTEKFRLYVPANDSCVIVKSTISDLILADNKTQISVTELSKMQEQIALLEKK